MPKSDNQKQKLLYVEKYLREHTDENHAVTTPQIIAYLEEQGIRAERKSIYSDIQTLCDFGIDIIKGEGPRDGYRLVDREFELAEVKLLVDLVQSSKFITPKKSRELIRKLEQFVSKSDAHKLQRQVVVTDRNKTANESIYYNVDLIYSAIAENVQIRFQYSDWNTAKKMTPRKNGAIYQVSPWLLLWDDENYYLVAYDTEAGCMKHYRVDKMIRLSLTGEERDGEADYDSIDVAAYTKKTFGMFAGEEKSIQLLCDSSLAGVIIDRFGSDISMRTHGKDRVLVRAKVAVSPQFFGWLAGLCDRARILAPEDVVISYQEYLKRILHVYKEEEP